MLTGDRAALTGGNTPHGEVLGRGTHPFHRNMPLYFLLPHSVVTATPLLSCSLLRMPKFTADHEMPSSPHIFSSNISYWLLANLKFLAKVWKISFAEFSLLKWCETPQGKLNSTLMLLLLNLIYGSDCLITAQIGKLKLL